MKCPLPLSTNACGFLTLGSTIANSRDHILTVYTWRSTNLERKEENLSRPRGLLLSMLQISLLLSRAAKATRLNGLFLFKTEKKRPQIFHFCRVRRQEEKKPEKKPSPLYFFDYSMFPCRFPYLLSFNIVAVSRKRKRERGKPCRPKAD